MGKESELLKAVKQKDLSKVQQLLSKTSKKEKKKRWHLVSETQYKVEVRHINVNCREPETAYTPLLLAVLNGSKDIAKEFIHHNADVKAKDIRGNTALHLAVFHSQLDMIELLLSNNIEVNDVNDDGNTALHIACQGQGTADLGSAIVKKLIDSGADVWIKNKFRLTALDLAASCNKIEVVKLLLQHCPQLRENKSAIVEAAVRGHKNVVEVLLEYGANCNCLDDNSGSSALHEAVRFIRPEVVQLLLLFQANPDLQNLKKETPRTIASDLPSTQSDNILKLLEEQHKLSPRVPKMFSNTDMLESSEINSTVMIATKNYPELPNDMNWTKNEPMYCSSCTERNPNTQILDGNLSTFWVIPVLHDAWTILDLHSEHIISGITIFGWKSPQMIKTFYLQCSSSINGPWKNVTTQTCECLGSTDPKAPAFPQTFSNFTFRSQYIRLYIVDNHAGSYICFQGIQLHGADCQVINALTQCGLQTEVESFISKGINTWKKFLNLSLQQVDELVLDSESKSKLWELIYIERNKMYPMKTLSWLVPPLTVTSAGETLPDFSVQSEPGVSEMVQVYIPSK
ncbi:alpha-latrotoxin-Lhe1a isoform X1 [Biomphalaria glabrata]|nr:alpha-latrotoxin-Lhe1a isoform X1 [Biomphalaria glabrata]